MTHFVSRFESNRPLIVPRLSLYYNLPEAATIFTKCGFALSTKRASEHPGKKHGIARSARHGVKPLLSSLNLPDPDALARRSDGPRPHPYLTVQEGSSCNLRPY
jgi:hypothetical protein